MKELWYNKKFLRALENIIMDNDNYRSEIKMIKKRLNNLDLIIETSLDLDECSNVSFDEVALVNKDNIKKNLKIEMVNLTAIIIVKDEERCIKRCINSIIDSVDKIVIVDTGSSDNTISIISDLNHSKINFYTYEWNNDFSEVRNFAIDKSDDGWILFIDADEELESDIELKELINDFNKISNINNLTICPVIKNHNDNNFITVRRIFRKESKIKFFGKIHEEPRKENEYIDYISVNISFKHDGYTQEVLNAKKKLERNYNLLKEMRLEENNNPRWIYFLIRDGGSFLNDSEIEELAFEALLKDKTKKITFKNLEINEYTFPILDILARLYLQKKEFNKLDNIISFMEKIYPENTNTIYYDVISKIVQMKNKLNELLFNVIEYRKNNYRFCPGMLHSSGYHIDFLIAILLFETANYKKAFEYFSFLNDKYIDQSFLDKYNKIFEVER